MNTVTLEKNEYDHLMAIKDDLKRHGVHKSFKFEGSTYKLYVSSKEGLSKLFLELLDEFETEISKKLKILNDKVDKHDAQVIKDKEVIKKLTIDSFEKVKKKDDLIMEKHNGLQELLNDKCSYGLETPEDINDFYKWVNRMLSNYGDQLDKSQELELDLSECEKIILNIQRLSFWQRIKFMFTGNIPCKCGANKACNDC